MATRMRLLAIVLALLATLRPSPAPADCQEPRLYAHWASSYSLVWGGYYNSSDHTIDVETRDDLVYALTDGNVYVMDHADPDHPAVCDTVTGLGEQLTLAGDRLYSAWYGQVVIADLSEPRHPAVIGGVTAGSITGFSIYDNILYVADASGPASLRAFDVTDGSLPVSLGTVSVPAIKAFIGRIGRFAYQPDDHGNLNILDLTDPLNPVVANTIASPRGLDRMDVEGHIAAIASDSLICLFDVTDPAAPLERARIQCGSYAPKLEVRLKGGLLADFSWGGARFWDVTLPGAPVALAMEARGWGKFCGAAIGDSHVYMLDQYGFLAAFDYRARSWPAPAAVPLLPGSDASIMAARAGFGYGLARVGELADFVVFDVRDADAATEIVRLPLDGVGYGLVLADSHAVVWSGAGITWIDITDPTRPSVAGRHEWEMSSNTPPAIRGTVVYRYQDSALQILDFADLAHPVSAGAIDTDGRAAEAAVRGEWLLVDFGGRVRIYDVTDPRAPGYRGEFLSPAACSDTRVGSLLIRGYSQESGFGIYDLGDPANPVLRSVVRNVGMNLGAVVHGSDLYVSRYRLPIEVYDIGDPERPVLKSTYAECAEGDLQMRGDRLWYNDGEPGTMALPLLCPDVAVVPEPGTRSAGAALVVSVSPNPFNPATRIRFATTKGGPVRVGVYDVRGRLVARLLDRIMAPGEHQASWSGCDASGRPMPSGAYVVLVETAEGRRAFKASLLK